MKFANGENMSAEVQNVSITTPTTTAGILLSDAAAEKVSALIAQEGRDDLSLRVAVQPGGCSGLRYQLSSMTAHSMVTQSLHSAPSR